MTSPTDYLTLAAREQFADAYIQFLLWSEADEIGDNFDHYGRSDLAPPSLAACLRDCYDFLDGAAEAGCPIPLDKLEQGGHDFCLTRNGHGAGFWDRSDVWGGHGDRLTELCRPYGEASLYLGDDGLLYVFGEES